MEIFESQYVFILKQSAAEKAIPTFVCLRLDTMAVCFDSMDIRLNTLVMSSEISANRDKKSVN